MGLPRGPKACYREINKRYWDNELPDSVRFHWLQNGEVIPGRADMRTELGTVVVSKDQADVYLNAILKESNRLLYYVIGHECIHIKYPTLAHGSRKWKEAVRVLAAKGFFERFF